MIQIFPWRSAPRCFREVFTRGGPQDWLAVIPDHLKVTWDRLGLPGRCWHHDAQSRCWIIGGAWQARSAAVEPEEEKSPRTGNLLANV